MNRVDESLLNFSTSPLLTSDQQSCYQGMTMKLLAQEKIDINANAADVFSFISDLENFGRWFPGVVDIQSEQRNADNVVGKTYIETVKIPVTGKQKIHITVKEREEHFIATEGRFKPLMPRMEMRVEPIDDSRCHMSWSMFSRNESAVFSWVVLPIFRWVMNKRAKVAVGQLKGMLEAHH